MQSIDFLIVGQGLAGTLLAYELTQRGQRIMVVDDGQKNASLTAAGMINPVVLKRFSPVWQGVEQIEQARQTMDELASMLSIRIDYPSAILRVFHNEKEKQTWTAKAASHALHDLLDMQFYPTPSAQLKATHGVGKVHHGGHMDLRTLLHHYRAYLSRQLQLLDTAFDYDRLAIDEQGCHYAGINAQRVVFCEGYGVKNNPYFNHLPLNGNKGEVLILRIPLLDLSSIVKSSVFIMPLPERGDDVYFVGSTYNWDEKDNHPTEAGKNVLLDKLKALLLPSAFAQIEVLEHRAGMRPTVADRRPLLGQHPQHKSLFILNGLGTRGVMLGATMVKHLTASMLDSVALPNEINITRFV